MMIEITCSGFYSQ